jgi:hypothetical protein
MYFLGVPMPPDQGLERQKNEIFTVDSLTGMNPLTLFKILN